MIINALVMQWIRNSAMIHFRLRYFPLKFVRILFFTNTKFILQIADFLLLLVHAAIHSTRHELILDPYPKLINPYNTSTTLLDQDGDVRRKID